MLGRHEHGHEFLGEGGDFGPGETRCALEQRGVEFYAAVDEGGGLGAVRVPDGVGVTGAGDGEGWGRGRGVGAHFGGWVVACLVKWSKEGLGGVRNGMK